MGCRQAIDLSHLDQRNGRAHLDRMVVSKTRSGFWQDRRDRRDLQKICRHEGPLTGSNRQGLCCFGAVDIAARLHRADREGDMPGDMYLESSTEAIRPWVSSELDRARELCGIRVGQPQDRVRWAEIRALQTAVVEWLFDFACRLGLSDAEFQRLVDFCDDYGLSVDCYALSLKMPFLALDI